MVLDLLPLRSDPQPGGYRDLTPSAALYHLGELRLVDVREPEEFFGPLGHVPGAALVPLSTVPFAAAHWDREAPTMLICRSGGRSARAATMLAGMGFHNLYNLTGGMLAWDAHGLPRLHEQASPQAQLEGQVACCFIAASGGQVEAGLEAFRAAAGPNPTAEDLLRAVRTIVPSEIVTEAEASTWVRSVEQRVG